MRAQKSEGKTVHSIVSISIPSIIIYEFKEGSRTTPRFYVFLRRNILGPNIVFCPIIKICDPNYHDHGGRRLLLPHGRYYEQSK